LYLALNIIFYYVQGIPFDVHMINWSMQWTPELDGKLSGEFVCNSLLTWIPFYHWKSVNPALTLLSQLKKIKKNSKTEKVSSWLQYLFVKDQIMQMLQFYQEKNNDTDVDDNWIFISLNF